MSDSLFFEEDRAAHMAVVRAIKSWKVEVIVKGESSWSSNGLRFATVEEAAAFAADLSSHWSAVRDVAVRATTDPVNANWPPVEP
jgi:hypothetical protein